MTEMMSPWAKAKMVVTHPQTTIQTMIALKKGAAGASTDSRSDGLSISRRAFTSPSSASSPERPKSATEASRSQPMPT